MGPEKRVHFMKIPYKNEYLVKINQEWVFEVNGFHRVKKGHVEWHARCNYLLNRVKCKWKSNQIECHVKSNATTSKQKSEVNNIDILVDWNQLKYGVIDFCFLF